ncbi:MAG: efflux RND transporter permease subunit, partial [Selenomonadaceae bacterium]|nr:efflux RND transporter permease subunit [Selenomonadaceae bacterium]
YIPIGFYGGMVGEIYKQFAVVMSVSLVISTINALSLSPALCVMILRAKKEYGLSDKIINGIFTPIFKPFNYILEKSRAVRQDVMAICYGKQIMDPEDAAYLLRKIPQVSGFFSIFPAKREDSERSMAARVKEYKGLDKVKSLALRKMGAHK